MLNIILFIVCSFSISIEASTLQDLAIKLGSDKALLENYGHNYVEFYEHYFSHLRNSPIKLFEIGFCHGISAFLWEGYFTHPDSHFYYIDIDPVGYKFTDKLSSRSELKMVNQSNNQLNEYIEKLNQLFDIIIDDGSHHTQHQIYSFKILFPYLKSGGIYIIEDLFGSYWQKLGGGGTQENPIPSANCAVNFLCNLVHDINYIPARNRFASIDVCPEHILNNLTYYQKHIKSIEFCSNICFIRKR